MDEERIEKMAEGIEEYKNGRGKKGGIYKAQADTHKGEMLADDIREKSTSLAKNTKRQSVDFHNLEDVQTRTFEYLEACARAKAFPSVMGLASQGFGVTSRAMNKYISKHDDATSEFLMQVKDSFADIMANAALYGNANPVSAIFQLKNQFAFTDTVQIEPVRTTPLSSAPTLEEVERNYLDKMGGYLPGETEEGTEQ